MILACIGHGAEQRNAQLGITGLLCHQDGQFVQLLEGPQSSVDLVMEKIVIDSRHSDIEIIQRRDLPEREFADWAMAIVCGQDDLGVQLTERCLGGVADEPISTPPVVEQLSHENGFGAD